LKLETFEVVCKLVTALELASSQDINIGGFMEVIGWLLLVESELCIRGCILEDIFLLAKGTLVVLGR